MTSFDSVDVDVVWRAETLAGTLHLPSGHRAGSMVVMLQGSGASDRDAEGYFTAVRSTFLRRGIATYSFDKPGVGGSTGDWRHHALHDRADQAVTVLDALAERREIDHRRLGVWGHSQGGWLAQIVAARRPDLACAISNSGPSIPVVAQDLYGCEHQMRSNGRSEPEIAAALDLVRALHAAAKLGSDFDEVESTLLASAGGTSWADYLPVVDRSDWEHLRGLVREAYQPLPTLGEISCPYLAVFGASDVLVPAWTGAEETGLALQRCPDATVVVFPHGDHRIQVGSPLEFAPGYLDLIGDWALARIIRAA